MTDKYTLFTNLQYVIVNGVRTHTFALLLCDPSGWLDKANRRSQLRGFGTAPEWETFDLDMKSLEYTLTDARSGAIMITDSHPTNRPIASGAVMQFTDGPRVDLIVCDQGKPIAVHKFDGEITQVWDFLPGLVRAAWIAPNMPTVSWTRVR